MEDILGFNDRLLPQLKQTKVFDPAAESTLYSMDDITDDEEGIATFQNAAMSHVDKERYELPRTRSQSLEIPSSKPSKAQTNWRFGIGNLVYAHKGKVVPCWFPGIIEAKTKKGFTVKFLAEFGVEDCVAGNMMMYKDYTTKKETDGEKFYEVPKKIQINFLEAQQEVKRLSQP